MSCAIPRTACPIQSWKRPVHCTTFETRTVSGGSQTKEKPYSGKSLLEPAPIDLFRNKEYDERMVTYNALQNNRRQFMALTGLIRSEFQRLLTAFGQAYQQHYPANQTAEGQPRQRAVGGGCK